MKGKFVTTSYSSRHKIWVPINKTLHKKWPQKNGWLKKVFKNFIKLMNLYFVNLFQVKFSCFYILYLLILLINFNQSNLINFNLVLSSLYWKCFRTSVIFIFHDVLSWVKFGLQVGLFLRQNTAVRSKLTSISCTVEFIVIFKS